jgi:hypothetical protein
MEHVPTCACSLEKFRDKHVAGTWPFTNYRSRYACVFPEHEWWPRWLPLRCIKPVTAIDGTHEETFGWTINHDLITAPPKKKENPPSSDLGSP